MGVDNATIGELQEALMEGRTSARWRPNALGKPPAQLCLVLFCRMINLVLPQTYDKNAAAVRLSRKRRRAAVPRINPGGSGSVNAFFVDAFARIARFAVSKGAAFCYAVAVGVAGNMIFHFVQPRDPAPAVATAPYEARPAAAIAPQAPPAGTVPAPTPVALPAAPLRPVAPQPAAAAPALPEPPAAFALPNPASLPLPALKPTALPPPPSPPLPSPSAAATLPAPAPTLPSPASGGGLGTGQSGREKGWGEAGERGVAVEAAVKPVPAANPGSAPPGASPAPSPAAALPPLGPAIEVAPIPPARAAAPPAAASSAIEAAAPSKPARAEAPPVPAGPANQAGPARIWELSDIWHPTRAVEKGLHWAGEQVPAIGGDAVKPRSPATAPASPIPLWPAATANPAAPEIAKGAPATQAKPGPGSGGLY